MNYQQAKEIRITQYLNFLGIKPQKIINQDYWYYSMIRTGESKPSLKVDNHQNCWYDHGLGKGGNILDLVMKIHNLKDISEALHHLDKKNSIKSFSFHQYKIKNHKEQYSSTPSMVKKLINPSLLYYLNTARGIKIEDAKKYCSEVHYEMNDQSYFAIGFQNDLNGWELRNKYWKGCIGSKFITTITNNKNECCVFEGFIDFLSFLRMYHDHKEKFDYVILNSTSNTLISIPKIQEYDTVHFYLDNDDSGRKAMYKLSLASKNNIDHSPEYRNYKDLNEFLLNTV